MSFDPGVGDLNDSELEKFLNVEKVKTQFHDQVSKSVDFLLSGFLINVFLKKLIFMTSDIYEEFLKYNFVKFDNIYVLHN